MAEKVLNTRIQLKYDTWANWESNSSRVLKKGEVALVEIPASTTTVKDETGKSKTVTTPPTVLFKVGDGSTKTFGELPWASALAADVHTWAKKTETEFLTWMKEQLQTGDIAYVTVSDFDDYKSTQAALIGTAADDKTKSTAFGKIAALQDGKADKATTLAGYGITDAYTTKQTDDKVKEVRDLIDGEDGLEERVDALEAFKDNHVIDASLSDSSENAVQNKVVKAAIDAKANSNDVYTKSQVYTKGETDNLLDDKANSADVYTTTVADGKFAAKSYEDKVDDNTTAIALLNDAETKAGSVAYAVKQAKDALVGGSTDTKDSATIAGAKKYADNVKSELIGADTDAATADTIYGAKQHTDDAVQSLKTNEIKGINDILDRVDGVDTLEGSFRKGDKDTLEAAKGYADQKLVDFEKAYIEADGGTIDKLNEIASWIADDEAGAAKVIADVAKNADDIADLTDRVSDLETKELTDTTYTFANGNNGTFTVTPEGGSAQTVDTGAKAYTDGLIGAASNGNTAATGIHAVIEAGDKALQDQVDDLDTRIDAYDTRFGTASDILVFNCGDADEIW